MTNEPDTGPLSEADVLASIGGWRIGCEIEQENRYIVSKCDVAGYLAIRKHYAPVTPEGDPAWQLTDIGLRRLASIGTSEQFCDAVNMRDWYRANASKPAPPQTSGLPEIPDNDADFTPDLARKIIAKYQEMLSWQADKIAELDDLRQAAQSPGLREALEFEYCNWEGRKSLRQARPISIRFGKSEWHLKPQWLMLAFDIDRDAEREFAMADMAFEDDFLPGLDLLAAQSPVLPPGVEDPLADLVARFSNALLKKLRLAQANGRSGWDRDDWEADCQRGLLRHLEKGDPRDVAAYCAFMWHHGWATSALSASVAGEAITEAATTAMQGGAGLSKPAIRPGCIKEAFFSEPCLAECKDSRDCASKAPSPALDHEALHDRACK